MRMESVSITHGRDLERRKQIDLSTTRFEEKRRFCIEIRRSIKSWLGAKTKTLTTISEITALSEVAEAVLTHLDEYLLSESRDIAYASDEHRLAG